MQIFLEKNAFLYQKAPNICMFRDHFATTVAHLSPIYVTAMAVTLPVELFTSLFARPVPHATWATGTCTHHGQLARNCGYVRLSQRTYFHTRAVLWRSW